VFAETKGEIEMRRNILSSIIAAALLPAGSLWAAPNAGSPAAQLVNQINEQTSQIRNDADDLEQYVRSGADEWTINAGLAATMAENARTVISLLDQVAAQPGATNDTRLQVEKLKNMTEEVLAFDGNAYNELALRALALHARDVVADAGNIENLCNQIHNAAQNLLAAR